MVAIIAITFWLLFTFVKATATIKTCYGWIEPLSSSPSLFSTSQRANGRTFLRPASRAIQQFERCCVASTLRTTTFDVALAPSVVLTRRRQRRKSGLFSQSHHDDVGKSDDATSLNEVAVINSHQELDLVSSSTATASSTINSATATVETQVATHLFNDLTTTTYQAQQQPVVETQPVSSQQQQLLLQPRNKISDWGLRFAGVARLYAKEPSSSLSSLSSSTTTDNTLEAAVVLQQRLCQATVVVIGLGGVGSWAAEALCRSGIGHLVLVDLDDICISNTNRQLHALSSTVGQMKIDEMKRRLQDVHPECRISLIHDFVTPTNVHELLRSIIQNSTNTTTSFSSLSSLICLDAMDGVKDKVALIAACADLRVPIVTCGGAAGKRDPTKVVTMDLSRVTEDRLLRTCRKTLRQDFDFERGLPFQKVQKLARRRRRDKDKKKENKNDNDEREEENDNNDEDDLNIKFRKWNIPSVFSTELTPEDAAGAATTKPSSFRRCDGTLGTACFVTGTFGFVAAARVVDMIANDKLHHAIPRRR